MAMAAKNDAHDVMPAGALLGHWRIARLLGEGGMGRVYLAEHAAIGRKVALKVLKKSLARSPELVERFFAEAHAVNRIRHPGIVEVTDCFIAEDGTPCIVMELLLGRTVTEEMAATRIHPVRVAQIGAEVADALDAAHKAGVIHRDLKPDNLFLVEPARPGEDSVVKVLDFGVAKLMDPMPNSTVHTVAGSIMGTPDYMAPEQLAGKPVDARADIYALGASLYHACTGRPPFPASNFGDLVVMHMTKPPTPPTCFANLPPVLEQVLLAMLEKDPARRPQTMGDVALLLRSAQRLGANMRIAIEADERARIEGDARALVAASTLSPRPLMPAAARNLEHAHDGNTQAFVAAGAAPEREQVSAEAREVSGPIIIGALVDARDDDDGNGANVSADGSLPPSGTLLLGSAEAPELIDDSGSTRLSRPLSSWIAPHLGSALAPFTPPAAGASSASPIALPLASRLPPHLTASRASEQGNDDDMRFAPFAHTQHAPSWAWAVLGAVLCFAVLGALYQAQPQTRATSATSAQVARTSTTSSAGPIASSEQDSDVDPYSAGGLAILGAHDASSDRTSLAVNASSGALDDEGAVRSDAPALTATIALDAAQPVKTTALKKNKKPARRFGRAVHAPQSEAVNARRRAVLDPFAERR